MKQFFKRVFNNSMFQGFSLLLSGSALSQIFSFLISPVLTRLYNPAEYGVNSVFMSVLLISSVFATLRLQVPISIAESDEEKRNLLNIGFITSALFSILLFAVVFIFDDQIIELFDVSEIAWLYILPISTFLIGVYELLYNNVLGNRGYKSMTVISTLKVVFQGVFQILLSFFNLGYIGLILGNLISYIIVDLMLLKTNSNYIEKPQSSKLKDTWNVYIDYPKFAFPAELLGMTSRQALTIILTYLFTPAASGFYALANRLIGVPINLIANSLRQVYIKEASVEFHKKGTIKRSFRNSSFALFGASIPIIIVIYWLGPIFFEIVFGEQWVEAGYYLRAMLLYFFTRFTIVPLMASMYVIGKTRFEIGANSLVLTVLVLITIIFQVNNGQDPILFLQAYSIGYTISYVVIYILMWINIIKLQK